MFRRRWTANTNAENHVNNIKLVVGFLTRDEVNKPLPEEDISEYQHTTFFKDAQAFSIQAVEYLLKWCPLKDELLSNATFEHRLQKNIDAAKFLL